MVWVVYYRQNYRSNWIRSGHFNNSNDATDYAVNELGMKYGLINTKVEKEH